MDAEADIKAWIKSNLAPITNKKRILSDREIEQAQKQKYIKDRINKGFSPEMAEKNWNTYYNTQEKRDKAPLTERTMFSNVSSSYRNQETEVLKEAFIKDRINKGFSPEMAEKNWNTLYNTPEKRKNAPAADRKLFEDTKNQYTKDYMEEGNIFQKGMGRFFNWNEKNKNKFLDKDMETGKYKINEETSKKFEAAHNKVATFSEGVGAAKQAVDGLTGFVSQLSEVFPPLIIAVMFLEGVSMALGFVQSVLGIITSILNIEQLAMAGELGILGTELAVIEIELGAFLMGLAPLVLPLIAITAIIIGLVAVLQLSYDAHKKYVEGLKETQKEQQSKANKYEGEQYTLGKRLQNMQDGPAKDRLQKRKDLVDKQLETARIRREAATLKLVTANQDSLWGETGAAYTVSSLWGGETRHAEEYEGVARSAKEMKEDTSTVMGGIFASDAQRQASALYDANAYSYGLMKEYKPELQKLYDIESRYLYRNGGSAEGLENDPTYQRNKERIQNKTGMSDEQIRDYLNQMQAEYQVDQAKKGMQVYVDKFKAEADQRQAARLAGMSPEELKSIKGTEKYTALLVQAEADKYVRQLQWEMLQRAFQDSLVDLAMIAIDILRIIPDFLTAVQVTIMSILDPSWWVLVILAGIQSYFNGGAEHATEGWKQEDIDRLNAPRKAWEQVGKDITDATNKGSDFIGVWSDYADSTQQADAIKKAGEDSIIDGQRKGMENRVMGQGSAGGGTGYAKYNFGPSANNGSASAGSTANQQRTASSTGNQQRVNTNNVGNATASVGNANKSATSTNTQTPQRVAHAQSVSQPVVNNSTAVKTPTNTNTTNNNKEGDIIIQTININTNDDPEAIKTELMNLIVELKDQISPRIVSRTVGEPPVVATDTSTTDANATNTNNTNNNNNNNNNSSGSSSGGGNRGQKLSNLQSGSSLIGR